MVIPQESALDNETNDVDQTHKGIALLLLSQSIQAGFRWYSNRSNLPIVQAGVVVESEWVHFWARQEAVLAGLMSATFVERHPPNLVWDNNRP